MENRKIPYFPILHDPYSEITRSTLARLEALSSRRHPLAQQPAEELES